MGIDRDFAYSGLLQDGDLLFRPCVLEQLELDANEPTCHDFRCPTYVRMIAMYGEKGFATGIA